MTKDQIVEFCKLLGLKGIDSTTRSGWVIARCPFARWRHEKGSDLNASFGIKIGKKTFGNCFSCHTHGQLDDLMYQLASLAMNSDAGLLRIKEARKFLDDECPQVFSLVPVDSAEDEEEDDKDVIVPFPEEFIAGYPNDFANPYFAERKGGPIPPEVAKMMGFKYDWKRRRLGVPIRDFQGTLVGFHGRTVINAKPPYLAYTYEGHWNRPVWSGEHRVDLTKPLVMVESIFDEARVMQVYRNVCSPLSASLNMVKIARMSEALHIIEMFDNDKAGEIASKKLRSQLKDSLIKKVSIPIQYGDPGATPVYSLAAILEDHVPLDEIIC